MNKLEIRHGIYSQDGNLWLSLHEVEELTGCDFDTGELDEIQWHVAYPATERVEVTNQLSGKSARLSLTGFFPVLINRKPRGTSEFFSYSFTGTIGESDNNKNHFRITEKQRLRLGVEDPTDYSQLLFDCRNYEFFSSYIIWAEMEDIQNFCEDEGITLIDDRMKNIQKKRRENNYYPLFGRRVPDTESWRNEYISAIVGEPNNEIQRLKQASTIYNLQSNTDDGSLKSISKESLSVLVSGLVEIIMSNTKYTTQEAIYQNNEHLFPGVKKTNYNNALAAGNKRQKKLRTFEGDS